MWVLTFLRAWAPNLRIANRFEVTIGIIAACIPIIVPLFSKQAYQLKSRSFPRASIFLKPARRIKSNDLNHNNLQSCARNQVLQHNPGERREDLGYRESPDSVDQEGLAYLPEVYTIMKTIEDGLTSENASTHEPEDLKRLPGFW